MKFLFCGIKSKVIVIKQSKYLKILKVKAHRLVVILYNQSVLEQELFWAINHGWAHQRQVTQPFL